MSVTALLGCLYGDEGKAKIVDYLSSDMDVIVRFQGGSNAGHTIHFNKKKFVLHLIPCGIFHPGKICVLSSGVVIDPFQLESEMEALREQSVNFEGRFFIDERAAIVLPIHKILDEKNENLNENKKIGTTKRGIGPCYADNVSRIAIRIHDLKSKDILKNKLEHIYRFHDLRDSIDFKEIDNQVLKLYDFGQKYKHYFINFPYVIQKYMNDNKKILFEGAQGSLLDIYFGTYPYVTSSHTISGGIASAVGFSPKRIDQIIGIFKSYFTRVGEGPFPTELNDKIGKKIQKQGNEFGSTTGRPRRCGWFDAVTARYSAMINGVDTAVITLLDVLSGFDTIKICVAYDANGTIYREFPADSAVLYNYSPVYLEMPGWKEDISLCKHWHELPKNAQKYVDMIEELINIPVKIISVGPSREQTITR